MVRGTTTFFGSCAYRLGCWRACSLWLWFSRKVVSQIHPEINLERSVGVKLDGCEFFCCESEPFVFFGSNARIGLERLMTGRVVDEACL